MKCFKHTQNLTAHTCLSGPSKIWSVYSLPIRGRLDGRSPIYFSIAENAKQASSASSSFVSSFFRRGCFNGSLEWRHSSSGLPRRADVSVRALDMVRFGGGLQWWRNILQLRINCDVSHLILIWIGVKYHSTSMLFLPIHFGLSIICVYNYRNLNPQETLCILCIYSTKKLH